MSDTDWFKKIWKRTRDGHGYNIYDIFIETEPEWFATVYFYDRKWHFRIGERALKENPKSWTSKKGWSTPATAKRKAYQWLQEMKHRESES